MSRARARSRARTGRPPAGGLIAWVLSLPARMHLRWLVILAVLAGVMGLYAHTLVSAPPMPPSQAPAETRPAATADVVTAHVKPTKAPQPAQRTRPTQRTSPAQPAKTTPPATSVPPPKATRSAPPAKSASPTPSKARG